LFRELTRRRLASFAAQSRSPTTSARSERRESNARILERLKRKKHELLGKTPESLVGQTPNQIHGGSVSRSMSPHLQEQSRNVRRNPNFEEKYWNALAALRESSSEKALIQKRLNDALEANHALQVELSQTQNAEISERLKWGENLEFSENKRRKLELEVQNWKNFFQETEWELEDVTARLKDLEHVHEEDKKKRLYWEQKASEFETKGEEMKKDNEELRGQVLKMENELDQDFIRVSEELLSKSSDVSDFNAYLSLISSRSTFWFNVKKGLDTLLHEAEERAGALLEENSKLRGERETIMADKIRLQKLVLQHDDERHALNQKIDEQKLAVRELNEMRIHLSFAQQGAIGQKEKLEEANGSIDKMFTEIHCLQDRLRSQTEQEEKLEKALEKAISEKSEFETQITAISADREHLQSQIDEYERTSRQAQPVPPNIKSMQENHAKALSSKDEQIAIIRNQLEAALKNVQKVAAIQKNFVLLQANHNLLMEKYIAQEGEVSELKEKCVALKEAKLTKIQEVKQTSTCSAPSRVCVGEVCKDNDRIRKDFDNPLPKSSKNILRSKYDVDDVKEESPLRCNDEVKLFIGSSACLTINPKTDSNVSGVYREQMKYYQNRVQSQEDNIERLLGYIDKQKGANIVQDPQILLQMKHEVEICNSQMRSIKLDFQQRLRQFLAWLNRSTTKCSQEISDLSTMNKKLLNENNAMVTDSGFLLEHYEKLENTNAELQERYAESQKELNNMELFFGELKRAYPDELLKTLQEEILHASGIGRDGADKEGLLSSTNECFNVYKQNDEMILNSKSNTKCVSCALSLATTLNRYRTLSEIRKVQYSKLKEQFRKYRSKTRKSSDSKKELIVHEYLEDLLNNVMSQGFLQTKDKQIQKLHSIVQDQTKVIQDKDSMLMSLHEEMIQQSPGKLTQKSEDCDTESVYKRFEKAEKHYVDESTRIQDYWDQLMKAIFDRVHTLEAEVSRLQSKAQEDGENDLKICKLEEEIRLLDSTTHPLPKSNLFMTRVVQRYDVNEEGELAALQGRIFLLEKQAVEEAFIRDELRSLLAAKTEPPPLKLESLRGVDVEVTCDWEKVAAQMEFEKAVMREEIETLSSALSARRSFQDYEELSKNECQLQSQESVAVLPEQNWPQIVEDLEKRLDEVMAQVRHHEQYQEKLEKVVGTLSRQQATCSEQIPAVVTHFEQTCAHCQQQWENRCTRMMFRITDLSEKCEKLRHHSIKYRSAHYRRHVHAQIKRFQIYGYVKNQRAKVEHILTESQNQLSDKQKEIDEMRVLLEEEKQKQSFMNEQIVVFKEKLQNIKPEFEEVDH